MQKCVFLLGRLRIGSDLSFNVIIYDVSYVSLSVINKVISCPVVTD